MSGAAYRRGNRVITEGIRRAYGLDVPGDRLAPKPTPRPAGWGQGTRDRALRFAAGCVRHFAERGLPVLNESELADAVRQHVRCGAATAREAARIALLGRTT